MLIRDLGTLDYQAAWDIQRQVHEQVLAGGPEHILVVEHTPVITFGRRPDVGRNLLASREQLDRMGVQVVQSDRGGDITFHGPGQIVAYPIVRLADHRLSVGCYVRRLQEATIAALAEYRITGRLDPAAVGVWVDDAKICAVGVRVRRGVSMHGLALNVSTDLRYFELIVPCGLPQRRVTSMRTILGEACPAIQGVKDALSRRLIEGLGATCAGNS